MAFLTLNEYKTLAGIPLTNTSQDALITMLLPWAQEAIEVWCDRKFDYGTYTEQLRSQNNQYICVRNRPITVVKQTGTLSASSTTITGLTSTSNIAVGMPVSGTNPTPQSVPGAPAIVPGTVVSTIVSPTSVTISQAANVSSTQTLFFGVQCWLDYQTYSSGEAPNTYINFNALTPGVDYSVDIDSADGLTSRSGMLFGMQNFWPAQTGWNGFQLSAMTGAFANNVKVIYQGGYQTIPADLKMACAMLVSRLRNTIAQGTGYISESVRDYSYALPNFATGGKNNLGAVMTPEILFFLSKYVNIAI